MKASLLKALLKHVLPILAVGLGALLLAAYPDFHAVFCAGKF